MAAHERQEVRARVARPPARRGAGPGRCRHAQPVGVPRSPGSSGPLPRSSSSAFPPRSLPPAHASISTSRFLSGSSRPTDGTRTGPPGGRRPCSASPGRRSEGGPPRRVPRHPEWPQPVRPCDGRDEPRCARRGGARCIRRRSPDRLGVAPRRQLAEHEHRDPPARDQASARMVAGPYSQLTMQSARARVRAARCGAET